MSSVKYDHVTGVTELETITLLDESPGSAGDYVSLDVPKWDVQFVRAITVTMCGSCPVTICFVAVGSVLAAAGAD